MATKKLNTKLINEYRQAAKDLGIGVTAPFELKDKSGTVVMCEAYVHDFASPTGAVIVSAKTERRERQRLRTLDGEPWICVEPDRRQAGYDRSVFIEQMRDWGWFGDETNRPLWLPES